MMLSTMLEAPTSRDRLARWLHWPLRAGVLVALLYSAADVAPGFGLHGRAAVSLTGAVIAGVGWMGWGLVRQFRRHLPILELAMLSCFVGGGGVLSYSTRTSAGAVFISVGVLTAAIALPLRRSVPLLVIGITVAGVDEYLVGTFTSFGFVVLAVLASFMGGLLREQRRNRLEQAELLLAETQVAHEEQAKSTALAERTRIAREIHDVLAHSLGALTVQLEAADALLEDVPAAARARHCVTTARGLAKEGLVETRRAVSALRGGGRSLLDTLTELAESYRGPITVELPDSPPVLAADATLALQRLAQEALTNVRKHAPGSPVSVRLRTRQDALELTVHNGRPHDADSSVISDTGGGFGLTGMRERLELLGGTVFAGPDEEGWTVRARVPL